MLDQAAAMGADKVTEQAVMDMLGQAGTEQMLQLLSACLDGKADEALACMTLLIIKVLSLNSFWLKCSNPA